MFIVIATRTHSSKSYTHEHNACKLSDVLSTVDEWDSRYRRLNLCITIHDSFYGNQQCVEFDLENRWIFDLWYQEQLNASISDKIYD